MMITATKEREALELCAYCPSLCQHSCPVVAASAKQTTTPWALMGLVHHVSEGRLELTTELAETLYACLGCGACTESCLHGVPVEGVMVSARREAVSRGLMPYPRREFVRQIEEVKSWSRKAKGASGRIRRETEPAILLIPGHHTLFQESKTLGTLFHVFDELDEHALACGDASFLDTGFELWAAGYQQDFLTTARAMEEAIGHAQHVVVMSAEGLHALKHIYPSVGVHIGAEISHISEFILPFMAGATVGAREGRVAYHDSCHLARHLSVTSAPREVLRRVLADELIELHQRGLSTWCCGGTGGLATVMADTAHAMAAEVIAQAKLAGAEHLVTFAAECVPALQGASDGEVTVSHAMEWIAQAVSADGLE